MSEKTEKATNYKLKKAKENGQVSKSTELNTCIIILFFLMVSIALFPSFIFQLKTLFIQLLSLTNRMSFSVNSMSNLHYYLLNKLGSLWLPFALSGILSIIVSTIAQTGFVWSAQPLVPDFKRLDLIKGLKRLFSTKTLFDAGKNSIKLALAILLTSMSLKHEVDTLINFMSASPTSAPGLLMSLISKLVLQLLGLLFAIAFIDKIYTRWKFAKDNRMSKQEIKDEYRQREGDPKIKAKIKQIQHQLRQKNASLEQVKTADVVITNPTHLAIALKYDRSSMPAPKVVCKAQGDLVSHIKRLAVRHNIPIIENKLFARALFATTSLNKWISKEHFPVAARIFRDLYRQREMA